jgi:hypothetical protein
LLIVKNLKDNIETNVWAKCRVLKCNALSTYSKQSGFERLQKKPDISKEIYGPNRHTIVLTSMGNDLSQFS